MTRTPAAADGTAAIQALLAAFDGLAGDAHLREWLGELGAAFSTVPVSWIAPFAATMRNLEPTAESRAAARAITDVARMTGAFARDAVQRLAGERTNRPASGNVESHAEFAARIDDAFREYTAGAEFDRARRRAAAAVLDWLEREPATASSIARILRSAPVHALRPSDDPADENRVKVMGDDGATLVRYEPAQTRRTCVLVVSGFTTGPQIFDLAPSRSFARTLSKHGVETWLLDRGRSDQCDRARTVSNQVDRIDRALDTVRHAANGRRPALVGHFHGGLLALLHCIRHPGKVSALVTLSTPVEFASPGDAFAGWLRACDGERLVDVLGTVPGPLIAALVAASSPMQWCGDGFFALLDGFDSGAGATAGRLARLEHARRFPPGFPGETFRGIYRAFYRDNAFATDGGALIDGQRYELSGLATPLLNVFARDDRVVPARASVPLVQWAGAPPDASRELRGGHFDLLTAREVHDGLLPDIAAWLIERAPET